jgi:hypothetical protein
VDVADRFPVLYTVRSYISFVYKLSTSYNIKMFYLSVTASAYAQRFGSCDESTLCYAVPFLVNWNSEIKACASVSECKLGGQNDYYRYKLLGCGRLHVILFLHLGNCSHTAMFSISGNLGATLVSLSVQLEFFKWKLMTKSIMSV